jgi:uncharacterized LabA/DUF88 family protein
MSDRVGAYVDGFNLYFGLRSKGWKRFYWLDIAGLVSNLLKPHQVLAVVKYFTARVSGPADKAKRQTAFLEANQALGRCVMYVGQYQLNPQMCRKCGNEVLVPNEKMTDVNIAVELMSDALQDVFDVALLISGDSDLTPPVLKIRELFPRKRIVVVSPPERHSVRLAEAAHAHFTLSRGKLARSLLPASVTKSDGFVLTCPPEWVEEPSETKA